MKKHFCLVLAALLLVGFAISAAAETHFNYRTSNMSGFPKWTRSQLSSGDNWHIEWAKGTNIKANRRAVVRAMSNGEFASSLFVYKTRSSKFHPYKEGYGNGNAETYIGGRLDNRDGAQKPLIVKGSFFN